jgi:adenine deaminase
MNFPVSAAIADFIDRLPKTETHLHIEGALPYELLRTVDPARFAEPPPFWADTYRYENFTRFEEILIEHALLWYTSAERYGEAAAVIFRGLQEQNVRYVETSFHLGILEFVPGLSGPAVIRAIKAAAPEGLEVRVFAGMLRNQYTPAMAPIIEQLHRWEELDGVDLHGQEPIPLESWTARVWQACREAGKVTKAHAGEFGPAGNVRQAIEELGVKRIQHGVRAVDDPAVVELARERMVAFDLCPISNLKLRVVPSLREHPIRELFDAGILCTVSTDDPFSFGNRLTDEYRALACELNFSLAELARIARNGFEISSLPAAQKESFLAAIDQLVASPPNSV